MMKNIINQEIKYSSGYSMPFPGLIHNKSWNCLLWMHLSRRIEWTEYSLQNKSVLWIRSIKMFRQTSLQIQWKVFHKYFELVNVNTVKALHVVWVSDMFKVHTFGESYRNQREKKKHVLCTNWYFWRVQ